MLDFLEISEIETKQGVEISPRFLLYPKSKMLMIKGGDFYAIWVEDEGLWSTDEDKALILIDRELDEYANDARMRHDGKRIIVKRMQDSSSGSIDKWHKYCQKQCRDSYQPLDETLVFSNSEHKREDYSSKSLPYPLAKGDIKSYDKLMSTLYSPEERHKLEWAIGSIVTGDSKCIQKFIVLYGAAGTGKSTVLKIIEQLFEGYVSVFDAKALGSSNSTFALEAFKDNPLVAIQHDGDLSRIEDNTRLNSLVSHEYMTINEKFKTTYSNRFVAFLFMGTNRPVKITDGRSGLLRRLIDVRPSGNKLSKKEYNECMANIPFELGAIAEHCKSVFQESPGYYDDYVPTDMMGASNDFYNFVIDSYHIFKRDDGTTLKQAWSMYKTYCEEAKVPYPFSLRNFKEELKTYFREFHDRFDLDGNERVRSYYQGFKTNIFDLPRPEAEDTVENGWLDLKGQPSLFDSLYSDCPAQYATESGIPGNKWEKVTTKLKDLDTSKTHYAKLPANLITIDFDLKNSDGKKDYELNKKAAGKFKPTYAELSQGGHGIHLEYIYDGNPDELASEYAPGIEIKINKGNGALRRRLTKCNDIPVATINSGLPLRERKKKKLINETSIKSEKQIRNLIKRNLEKEIHPSTKCSVDFIKKILDDAYESGLSYDVSDMHNAVFAFAAKSTNQSDVCIKTVSKMKFKSDEPSEAVNNDEKPIVFFDCEVFPNLFLVNWKLAGKGKPMVRMINPKPKDIEDILDFRLVGYNCRRYDNHMLYACLMGYSNEQLYKLSQKIVNSKKGENRDCFFGEAYNISYTDIYDFASAGNKKSLKKLEIEMGFHHQELGLPWDQPVPESKWEEVAEYCDNDVLATEAAFYYLKADWTARQILADLAGMSVNDTTNSLTTRIIFGKNRHPQDQFCYRNLADPVLELDPDVEKFLKEACPKMMAQTHGDAHSLLPYFPGYKYENGKSTYRGIEVGEGGLVLAEHGMYGNVALLDVSSMHPHSTIAECLFGPIFTRAYREIVEGRVDIKHEAWGVVNDILGGALTPYIKKVKDGEMSSGDLANALKTAINSVYGLTSASFENPFRDNRNKDNIVAKRGALFMVDLKYAVEARGYKVAHIKTDSIKIPDATPEIIQFVMDFGEKYGYTFEHEATYDRMCLVNNAVYIAKYKDAESCEEMYGYVPGKNQKKGNTWTATGKQFAVPYVFKKLFSHEEITSDDMREVFSVRSALYLDMNEGLPDVSKEEAALAKLEAKYKKGEISDTIFEPESIRLAEEIAKGHDYHFVGRVGEFCPVKTGFGGGLLMREQNSKYYAASGTTGYRWLESELILKKTDEKTTVIDPETGQEREIAKAEGIPEVVDAIDESYYEELTTEARDAISQYGDFDWFVSDEPYISPPRTDDFMNIPEDADEELPWD